MLPSKDIILHIYETEVLYKHASSSSSIENTEID